MQLGKKLLSLLTAAVIAVTPVAGIASNVHASDNLAASNYELSEVKSARIKLSNAAPAATDRAFWKSMSSDYYYKQMTSSEKTLYSRINDACMNVLVGSSDLTQFDVDCSGLSFTQAEAKKVLYLYEISNPQIFFLSLQFGYYMDSSNKYVTKLVLYLDENFVYASKRNSARDTIRLTVYDYMSAVSQYSLIENKEYALAYLMCYNIDYDTSAPYNQSIYSACLKKTVCAGYMSLFGAVMNALGFECAPVVSEDHAWNIVKLHGYWYYIDVTNMDQSFGLYYYYYNNNVPTETVLDYCKSYLPSIKYDDIGSDYSYSLRYFLSNNILYFIVNDNSSSYIATPAYALGDFSSIPSTVTYKSTTYTVSYSSECYKGWRKMGTDWIYYNPSGIILTGWTKISGDWYFLDKASGAMKTGWLEDEGKWYYFTPSTGVMVRGWKQINNKWFFFDADGSMVTGWKYTGGAYYYFNTDGSMVTGWKGIGGKWYLFSSDGIMQTGWQKDGSKWYYFNTDGSMVTGWKFTGGYYYYFNTDGSMVTGWKGIGGKWYYFENDGSMAKGWKKISGSWYYLNQGGDMKTGWLKTGGKWYYFASDGKMVTGKQTIGGKVYNFGSDGVWDGKE